MNDVEIPGYSIEGVVGKGGMGVVYKATQIALDRPVAIKVLAPQIAADEDFITDFAREAKTTALLHHPNIVPVYDFGSFEGGFFLSMHFIDGRTLHQVLKVRRPPMEECIAIIRQIAEALDFAHSKGVIHRDIKPSNIMLANNGTAMLMDFGVAHGTHTPRLSDKGRAVGTPDYMSPEQCSGRELDHRCDIYALGAVLYQLLTGRPPFKGETKLAVMYQHVHAPPPSPRQVRPDISPQIEAVVIRALSKAPDRRYGSAGAFAAALDAAFRAPAAQYSRHGAAAPPPVFQAVAAAGAAAAAPAEGSVVEPAPVPEPAQVPSFKQPEPVCLVGAAAADVQQKPPQLPIYYAPVQPRSSPWMWVSAIAVVCILLIAGAALYARQNAASTVSTGPAPTVHKSTTHSIRSGRATSPQLPDFRASAGRDYTPAASVRAPELSTPRRSGSVPHASPAIEHTAEHNADDSASTEEASAETPGDTSSSDSQSSTESSD